jgi:hypothetical protein
MWCRFAIIFVFLFSIACQKKSDKENSKVSSKKITFNGLGSIRLFLDENTVDWSKKIQNSIQFYNMDGNISQKIICEKEGPNGIGTIFSFLYVGQDSLFVLNTDTHKVHRISDSGKLLSTYHLPQLESKSSANISIPYSANGIDMLLKNKHLYIPGIPGLFYFENRNEYINKGKLGIDVNLVSAESRNQIEYPDKSLFLSKNFTSGVVAARCTPNSKTNSLVYSFPADPKVYVYSLTGDLKEEHILKSKSIDDIEGMSNWLETNIPLAEYRYYLKNSFYEGLYYDKYKDLYYRIAKHGTDKEFTNHELETQYFINTKYTLLVADSNFNTLGEFDLPDGSSHQLVTVTRKGILILNKQSPKEDELKFDLYSVSEK